MQTTILEMGEPSSVTSVSSPSSSTWIHSRQYTGRIVTVSNAKVFDEPVYNYTRDFPYLWEEMSIPIRYGSELEVAEKILLAAAVRHTGPIVQLGANEAAELQRRYQLPTAGVEGLRDEDSIAELCRREGIAASMYYGWSKEFLEAGKKRLSGDTARAATTDEVRDLRRETGALKEVVADLVLENRLLKKSMSGAGGDEA